MPVVRLTARTIEAQMRRLKGRLLWLTDEHQPGLTLRIRRDRRGRVAAWFMLRYGTDRTARKMLTLGRFGALTVEAARDMAQEALGRVARGEDPVAERQRLRAAMTFTEWVDLEYVPLVKRTKKSWRDDVRFLGVAKGAFGRKRLRDLTADDVAGVLKRYAEHKAAGIRCHASIRACLQEAWRRGKIPTNVARFIRRQWPEPLARERTLSEDEMRRLLLAVTTLRDPATRAAFFLLAGTGARRSEVLRSTWSAINLSTGEWRLPTTKAGRPQVVKIPPRLVRMLADLKREQRRKSDLVIPGKTDPTKPRPDLAKAWEIVRKRAGLENVRLHDLRRTVGKRVSDAAGVRVAQRVLRHQDLATTEKHYSPDDLDLVGEALNSVAEGMLAAVLPFPAAGAGGA